MTGSGPKLGVLLLLAVLLQTVVVTITVLHFTTALNSVRKRKYRGRTGDARRLLRIAAQCAPRGAREAFERSFKNVLVDTEHDCKIQCFHLLLTDWGRGGGKHSKLSEHKQSRTRLISTQNLARCRFSDTHFHFLCICKQKRNKTRK